jgi:tektin-1
VEKAIAACSDPLSVSEQCQAHRMQRRGVDLCNDNVSKHLEYEIATIQASCSLEKEHPLRQVD